MHCMLSLLSLLLLQPDGKKYIQTSSTESAKLIRQTETGHSDKISWKCNFWAQGEPVKSEGSMIAVLNWRVQNEGLEFLIDVLQSTYRHTLSPKRYTYGCTVLIVECNALVVYWLRSILYENLGFAATFRSANTY